MAISVRVAKEKERAKVRSMEEKERAGKVARVVKERAERVRTAKVERGKVERGKVRLYTEEKAAKGKSKMEKGAVRACPGKERNVTYKN